MAVYTPHQAPRRSQKRGKLRRLGDIGNALLRRKKKAPQYRGQAIVSGAQRVWKWKRFSSSTMLLLAVGGLGLVVVWLGYQFLTGSNVFRLTDIRISGNRVMSERQILEISGLQRGTSLLRFDEKEAASKILTHPWVDHVEVKPQWPSAVDIIVHEQLPLALVDIEGDNDKKLRYLNNQGRVFADVEQGLDIDYPVITGVQLKKDIDAGSLVKGSLAEAASAFLQLAAKGNAVLPIQAISEVHLDPAQGLVIYLVDRPFPIYYGKDKVQTKYFRLLKVLEQLYSRKLVDAVKEIRMDYSDDKILVVGAEIDE